MPSLTTQKDFRSVQRLPFCYLCGKEFLDGDQPNKDHIPPQSIFLKEDREPLWLPTHVACNTGETITDQKIGQLIALKYGKAPKDAAHRRLEITWFPNEQLAALTNLDVDAAVWRWIRGFHAALYRNPLLIDFTAAAIPGSLVTPFPKAPKGTDQIAIEPLRPQHSAFVQTIKLNRLKQNLDRISCNKGKLLYECVWNQADNNGPWMCMFAVNVYDWKDLGSTGQHPPRGCAGFYMLADGSKPEDAAQGVSSPIIIPNLDPLDPFSS